MVARCIPRSAALQEKTGEKDEEKKWKEGFCFEHILILSKCALLF